MTFPYEYIAPLVRIPVKGKVFLLQWLPLLWVLAVVYGHSSAQSLVQLVEVSAVDTTVVPAGALAIADEGVDVSAPLKPPPSTAFFPAKDEGWRYDIERLHWVQVRLLAHHTGRYFIHAGYHDSLLLYEHSVGTTLGGAGVAMADRSYPFLNHDPRAAIIALQLTAGEPQIVTLRYANKRGEGIYATNTRLQLTIVPERTFEAWRGRHLLVAGGLVGGIALLLLYHLGRLWAGAARVDFAFAVLMVAMLLFLALDHGVMELFFSGSPVPDYLIYPSGGLGLCALMMFGRAVFAEVDYWRPSDSVMGGLSVAMAIVGIGPALAYGLSAGPNPFTALLPNLFRAVATGSLLIFVAAVIYHARRTNGGPIYIIAFGLSTLALTVVADVTQAVIEPFDQYSAVAWYLALIEPVFNYLISFGIILMCGCFAVAVANLRRNREIARERAFHLRVAETEQRALRAQMNPHFIFNTLNSIKAYVIRNDRRAAADYLTKFARLIRLVLDGSAEAIVPLSRELDMLKLYLELERQRSSQRFALEWAVDPEIDRLGLSVPPTLLQPFAENAVWHGVRHLSDRSGLITIVAKPLVGAEGVRVEIMDNGVGRAVAAASTPAVLVEHKVTAKPEHVSRGLDITHERARLARDLHGVDISVRVDDLTDSAGRATGTCVIVTITAAA